MANHDTTTLYNYNDSFQNFDQITFSFESKSREIQSKPSEKHRSIEQYLRLKTNQSIQDKIGTQISQHQHIEQKNPGKRSISLRKTLKGQQGQACSIQYQKQLMQQEFDLRIQSLIKQYELKFIKQEDYCKLIQWKYKEQIENLNEQINVLQQSKKRSKNNSSKTLLSNCSICSDGQVISHLQKIINEVQSNNDSCFQNKKELTKNLEQANNKLQILEQQHEKLYNQYKILNKQLRTSNNDHSKLNQENQNLKSQIEYLRQQLYESNDKLRCYKQQSQNYQYKLKEYYNKNLILQEQLKNKDEQSVKNSKATVQSSQSVLTSLENSMNSSFLRSRPSQSKHRNSISKILIQEVEGRNNENRQYYQKPQENYKNNSRLSSSQKANNQRIENLKWKYF